MRLLPIPGIKSFPKTLINRQDSKSLCDVVQKQSNPDVPIKAALVREHTLLNSPLGVFQSFINDGSVS